MPALYHGVSLEVRRRPSNAVINRHYNINFVRYLRVWNLARLRQNLKKGTTRLTVICNSSMKKKIHSIIHFWFTLSSSCFLDFYWFSTQLGNSRTSYPFQRFHLYRGFSPQPKKKHFLLLLVIIALRKRADRALEISSRKFLQRKRENGWRRREEEKWQIN